MKIIVAVFLLLAMSNCAIYAQIKFNGGFEDLSGNKPTDWRLTYAHNQDEGYKTALDSNDKQSGKYALSLEKLNDKASYAAVGWSTNQSFEGKTIELTGYIKTKDITAGRAGLWMRIEGHAGNLMGEFMEKDGPLRTTDWKKYSIKYNYRKEDISSINVGGILMGNGKAWFDSLELLVDGKPLGQSRVFVNKGPQSDTTFSRSSKISLANVTPQQLVNLAFAGQFWGFLKYHHPAVAKGDYYWDAELFKLLPGVIEAKNNQQLSKTLEAYLDALPKPALCKTCSKKTTDSIALMPDYGDLFNGKVAGKSLTDKLNYIKENRNIGESYYLGIAGAGNPSFKNERAYPNMPYPDAGYRLLSLYRYWTMINYFFPYKHQIDENWNKVLKESIPIFLGAKNEKDYALSVLALIAKVKDTHANLWGGSSALNSFKGKFGVPVQAKFMENKLVVTGFFADTLGIKNKLKVGDLILGINGKNVEELIKEYLPITPASNYETQLRDLPPNYLLRSNDTIIRLKVKSNDEVREVEIPTINLKLTYKNIDYQKPTGYHLLNNDIGYVYPAKYKNTDLPAIKKLFENTKGMVVDMRCYPSDFMPFTFGSYIKKQSSPFVKFTNGHPSYPGLFTYTPTLKNGGEGDFNGKVIVIVNASSQSNAEYTTMAFQSAPNVRVLGSITAGADGNVSNIMLPGGISTMISGIGVFYPDGTPTQRVGVKIDYPMHPTIKGITEGRDELLERAIELLNKGW